MFNTQMFRKPSSILFALLGISLLVFAGCWGSKFTLIPPDKAKVDRAYVGDWDAVNSKGDHTPMLIRNIDDHLYAIELLGKYGESDAYVGFITDVKGSTFAHVRELTKDGSIPDGWGLVRVALAENNTKLTLEQMDDKFFNDKPINSPEQLRQIVEQNVNNPAMYAKDETITATRIVPK